MEILVYGAINSMVLAMMAIGFTFVYGVCRRPNFAHGAIYVVSGFVAWIFLNRLKLNYPVSILLAVVVSAVIGVLIYRFILIRVRGMAISEIIATYAIGVAMLEFLRWIGFKGTTYSLPVFKAGGVILWGVPIDMQRVFILILGVGIFLGLLAYTHFTKLGLALKGMAQDEQAALMLGIDSDRMAIVAMAIGSALACIAAMILLPLGNITVESGYTVLILAIAVCILGGLGSWKGAILASILIGFLQIITWVYIASHYQMVAALLAIIFTLIVKPSGMYGRQKELEERV